MFLEEEAKKRTHELQLAKLQLETQRLKDKEHSDSKVVPTVPRLPPFDEEKDDIDAFIKLFEMYAAKCKWQEDTFAMYLSSLLRGKALEVYSRMAKKMAKFAGFISRKAM